MTPDEARRRLALGKDLLGPGYLPDRMEETQAVDPQLDYSGIPSPSANLKATVLEPDMASLPRGIKPPSGADRYRSFLDQGAPLPSEYQPSGKRKFASILAGIGAGFTGIGNGIAVGKMIRQAPYRKAVEEHAAQGAGLKDLAQFEEGMKLNDARAQHLTLQGDAEKARAGAERARQERMDYETSDLAHNRAVQLANINHPGRVEAPPKLDLLRLTLKDGKKIVGNRNPITGEITANGVKIDPAAIENFDSSNSGAREGMGNNRFSSYLEAWRNENPNKPWTLADDIKMRKIVADPTGANTARANFYGQSVGSMIHQRGIMSGENYFPPSMPGMTPSFVPAGQVSAPPRGAQAPQAPQQPQAQAMNPRLLSMWDNPDEFHTYAKPEQQIVGRQWTEATGLPLPNKLASADQTREMASRLTKTHVGIIKELINDPELKQEFGTFNGSLQQFLNKVGSGAMGSPSLQEKVSRYITSATNLKNQEVLVAGGSRGSDQLRALISEITPAMRDNMAVQLGKLSGIESNADMTLEALDQQRFGGKSRKSGRKPGAAAQPQKSFAQEAAEALEMLRNKRKGGQ